MSSEPISLWDISFGPHANRAIYHAVSTEKKAGTLLLWHGWRRRGRGRGRGPGAASVGAASAASFYDNYKLLWPLPLVFLFP